MKPRRKFMSDKLLSATHRHGTVRFPLSKIFQNYSHILQLFPDRCWFQQKIRFRQRSSMAKPIAVASERRTNSRGKRGSPKRKKTISWNGSSLSWCVDFFDLFFRVVIASSFSWLYVFLFWLLLRERTMIRITLSITERASSVCDMHLTKESVHRINDTSNCDSAIQDTINHKVWKCEAVQSCCFATNPRLKLPELFPPRLGRQP